MITALTSSADETRRLAAALAAVARPGDLLVLAGDLGAGKTAFVQGYAHALGVDAPVTSPTFTLANRYKGRLEVNHLDVYRLEHLDEIEGLGIYELLDGRSVTLIEWGDAIAAALPPDYLEVRLELGAGDDDRRLALSGVGVGWATRADELRTAIAPWLGDPPC